MTRTAYCFDLDGTITREEVLPILAREVGLYEEIAALTDATIKGVIPFRKSFLLRCRLLGDVPIARVQEIIAGIALYEKLVRFIHARPAECFVITGNLDQWVKPLEARLGCRLYASRAAVADGRLSGVEHVLDKSEAIADIRKRFDHIVAIGDGMGDVPMFEASDIRIAFGATHAPIQSLIQFADYITFSEDSLCALLDTQ